jgi:hypothetical protein
MADVDLIRAHLARQADHWSRAAARLTRLDDLAGPEAWGRLEQYLGVSLRRHLAGVADRVVRRGEVLRSRLGAAESATDFVGVHRELLALRRQYLRAETTLDFFADALNTRTTAAQGALLRACDTLAYRSMAGVLEPIGLETPVTLTYIDKGLGASILKAGLRLWDGGDLSPVAAIKIVRHNLERPTALVHEAGHQVAHIVGWNEELAAVIAAGLGASPPLARIWASWASEIAADAVAFVHTGFGSVLSLHDVVAAEPELVFRVVPGDPHPMSFLRIELGVALCRHAWGNGEWDGFSEAWRSAYPLEAVPAEQRAFIEASMSAMPLLARLTIGTPMRAFRGRSLADLVSPDRVSPAALTALERRLGPALYSSSHWVWTECLRLLAISALHAGRTTGTARPSVEQWMLPLGGVQNAA